MVPELEKKLLVKFFVANANIGFCAAANLATQKASGEFLCIIDHDIEMTPLVLDDLVANLETDNTVGAVQPKVVNAYDKRFIDSDDVNENGSIRGFEASLYINNRDILYPIGACFIVRRKTFQHVGGFYDDFFMGAQDIDFGWRLWLLGYKVKAILSVEIYHSRGTLREKKEVNLQLGYFSFKNKVVMVIQNFETKNIVKYFLRLIRIPFFHLLSNPSFGYYEIRALFWVAGHLKLTLKRRYMIQSFRKLPDDELMGMLKYIFPKPLNETIGKYISKFIARKTTL